MSGFGRRKPEDGLISLDYSDQNWNTSKKRMLYVKKNNRNPENFNDRSQHRRNGGNPSYNNSADNTNKIGKNGSFFYHNGPKKGTFVESDLPKYQQGNRGIPFSNDCSSMGSLSDPITPSNLLDNNPGPVPAYPQYNDMSMFYGNDGARGQPHSHNFSQSNYPYLEWIYGPQNSFNTPEAAPTPYEYGTYEKYGASSIAGNKSYPEYMPPKPIAKLPPSQALEGKSTIDQAMGKSIAPIMSEETFEERYVHAVVDSRKNGCVESSRYVKPQSPISDQGVLLCVAHYCSSSGVISEEKDVDGFVKFKDESSVDASLSTLSEHLEEKEVNSTQSRIQQPSKTEKMTQGLGEIDIISQIDKAISVIATGKQMKLPALSDNDASSEAFHPDPGEVVLQESDAVQESIEHLLVKIGMVASRSTECIKCLKRKEIIQAIKNAMSRRIRGREVRLDFLGPCEVLLEKWVSNKGISAQEPDECENCQMVSNELHQGRKIEYFMKCCYPASGGYYPHEIPKTWRAYRGLNEAIQAVKLLVTDSHSTEQEAGEIVIDCAETEVKNHRQHLKADEPANKNQTGGLESESAQVISDASIQTAPACDANDFEICTEFQITEAAGLEVKNERIFRKIDAISKEKELIELEVVKKDDEIAVLSKKNQDITAKLERTRGQLSVAEQQIDDDRRINSVLRQYVKTYQGAAEKTNSNHQRVSSDFCSEQVLRTTAETSAKDFKSNFETEQKNAIALAEHMAKLELEKKILDEEAAEKDKKIMEQTNRVHNAQAFILLAEDRANEVEKECLRMLNDKLEIIEAERTGTGDAESRATTLESENAAAKTRAAKAETAKSAAEARVVIAETECEIVKSENETLKAASATRFKLIESLLSKNTQLEKDGEDLMAASRNLSARNTNLKTQNEELRTKNTKLETLIENAKRDLATQQQLTKKAQSEAKRAREDLDALQITVDQQIATINTHNSLINEQYAKIIQIELDNKATRQENGELCNRLMAQFTQKLEDLTEKNAEAINKLEDKIHELQNPDLFFDAEDSVIEIIHEKLNKINEDMESANNKSKNSHNTINECKKTIHYAQNELHIMNYHQSSFWLTSFVCFLFIFSAFNNKVIPGIFQLSEPATQDNGLNYDFLSQPDNKGLEIPETQCNWTYAESSQTLQPFQRTSIVALHFSGSQAAGLNSAKKVHDIFGSSGIDSAEENILAFLTFSQLFEGFTHAFDTPQKVAVWGFLGGVSYLTYQYIHIR